MTSPRLVPGLVIVTMLLPLAGSLGCSDYDLHRPDDTEPAPEDEPVVTGEPDIEVSPASLDFGGVLKNCPSAPQTVTITNVGDEFLDVYGIDLGNPHFAVDWDGSAFQLAPGSSRDVDVTFTPLEYTLYEGDITVSSNDPDEAEVTVDTIGNGDDTALYEEGFTQESFDAVDVMWVVDNSGSMGEELDLVRDNFESFITEFVGLGLDYHLAVITTDMDTKGQRGQIQGNVISPASADPIAEFLAAVDLGSSGSGSERGTDAVQAALTDPLLSGGNSGFLREDAALAAIVLSDEDDSSNVSQSSFVSWFQGLKSDHERVSFNAIVGDPSGPGILDFGGCSDLVGTDLLQASAGDRYVDVAAATGGIWRSICYEDYDETLAHVSLSSAGMVTTWYLSQTPTNWGLIEVYVDGTRWYYSLLDGFTYDEADNSITFHGDALPPAEAYVLVKYPISGECAG